MMSNKLIRFCLFCILFATILSVFYFSWLPNPSFKTEKYLPNWLIKWTDENGILRTGVPFVLLGANAVLLKIKTLSYFKIFWSLFALLFTAEFGQLFLPNRRFDVMDILVGAGSLGLGIFAGRVLKIFCSIEDNV